MCRKLWAFGVLVGFLVKHALPTYEWETEGKQRVEIAKLKEQIRIYKMQQPMEKG